MTPEMAQSLTAALEAFLFAAAFLFVAIGLDYLKGLWE